MSLSGQLSDLSLAELIEFFCNLRKTGRLKVEYPESPGVFYFKEGELVDAQLGAINGTDAVYHALRLSGAAFDFNTHIYASRRTIYEPWMQLILEGLRRVDEESAPARGRDFEDSATTEVLANGSHSSSANNADKESIEEAVAYMDDLHRLEDGTWAITSIANPHEQLNVLSTQQETAAPPAQPKTILPPSFMTSGGVAAAGGRHRTVMIGAVSAFLICGTAVGALTMTNWFGGNNRPASTNATTTTQPNAAPANSEATNNISSGAATNEAAIVDENANRSGAVQRENQVRTPAERANARAAAAGKNPAVSPTAGAATEAVNTAKPATSEQKTVMVQVTVDESGRVSQAAVANSRPGMESYESSALRAARQRRYPAGKSGVITVPVKIN